MTEQIRESNKGVAKRLVEEVLNKGNMKVFDELFADNYVMHNMPVPDIPGTKEGFRKLVLATRKAFPDVHVHIEDMVADNDFAVFHDRVEATSKNDFFGVPANGKRIAWTEIHFLKIAGKSIVEHWSNFDQLGILQQLGVIPAGK
jgi:steroid delta-isomerase-like uncharacterized protein